VSADPAKTKSAVVAEWDALLERYPLGSRGDLARQVVMVVGGNALIVRFLVLGQLRPFHLVALVASEAVILTAIAWVQSRTVPRSALMEKPQPLRARLGVLAFGAVWLGFVYAVILGAYLDSGPEILAALREPLASFRSSGLGWPLGLTVVGALADAAWDRMHWRERGGWFLSTPGFNSGARWLTLFLGGIPFFVPLAFSVWLIATLAGRGNARRQGAAASVTVSRLAPILPFALSAVVFGLMAWLIGAGVSGWAVGFCSAKLAGEALLVFLPLIATKARAEELEKETAAGKRRHRRRKRAGVERDAGPARSEP
jgi:hypothetical protein